MFSAAKLSAVVLALVSLAHATIVITSSDLKGAGTNTITWTSSDPQTDPPSFSIELTNPSFNHQFAIGNNIPTSAGTYTFEMPQVATGQFVDISNVNSVLAQSPSFSIDPVTSSSVAATSGTPTGSVPGTATQSSGAAIPTGAPRSTLTASGTGSSGTGIVGSATIAPSRTSVAPSGASTSTTQNGVATVRVPVALLAVGLVAGLM
ncbi:hypothetical protein BU17DRAFT_93179 [Hysterangium stoloniferum]|nr:hypothetical protein BU17DRAFT_93179 [Hysterangium stoloniferum]